MGSPCASLSSCTAGSWHTEAPGRWRIALGIMAKRPESRPRSGLFDPNPRQVKEDPRYFLRRNPPPPGQAPQGRSIVCVQPEEARISAIWAFHCVWTFMHPAFLRPLSSTAHPRRQWTPSCSDSLRPPALLQSPPAVVLLGTHGSCRLGRDPIRRQSCPPCGSRRPKAEASKGAHCGDGRSVLALARQHRSCGENGSVPREKRPGATDCVWRETPDR